MGRPPPNVVCIFQSSWGATPWSQSKTAEIYGKQELMGAYERLSDECEKQGMRFRISNFAWLDKDVFTQGWRFDGKRWQQDSNISADYIFDKTPLNDETIPSKQYFSRKNKILNSWFIDELCSDKWKTYQLFPQLVPKCLLVRSMQEMREAAKQLDTALVVVKPRAGSSAKGLHIVPKNRLPEIEGDYIIQEFVDARKGASGLYEWVHDIRMVMLDGKFHHAFMRKATDGLITNVSRGATVGFVDNEDVPANVLHAAELLDTRLSHFRPRFYAADFMIDNDGRVWLIELNSKPAFFQYPMLGRPELGEDLLEKIVEAIARVLKVKN